MVPTAVLRCKFMNYVPCGMGGILTIVAFYVLDLYKGREEGSIMHNWAVYRHAQVIYDC